MCIHLPGKFHFPLLRKATRQPLFAAFLLSSYTLGDHYLLSPGRLSSLRKVGDVAQSLSEIQVESIKSIIFLTLWLDPSKKSSSGLQSLTFLRQAMLILPHHVPYGGVSEPSFQL